MVIVGLGGSLGGLLVIAVCGPLLLGSGGLGRLGIVRLGRIRIRVRIRILCLPGATLLLALHGRAVGLNVVLAAGLAVGLGVAAIVGTALARRGRSRASRLGSRKLERHAVGEAVVGNALELLLGGNAEAGLGRMGGDTQELGELVPIDLGGIIGALASCA